MIRTRRSRLRRRAAGSASTGPGRSARTAARTPAPARARLAARPGPPCRRAAAGRHGRRESSRRLTGAAGRLARRPPPSRHSARLACPRGLELGPQVQVQVQQLEGAEAEADATSSACAVRSARRPASGSPAAMAPRRCRRRSATGPAPPRGPAPAGLAPAPPPVWPREPLPRTREDHAPEPSMATPYRRPRPRDCRPCPGRSRPEQTTPPKGLAPVARRTPGAGPAPERTTPFLWLYAPLPARHPRRRTLDRPASDSLIQLARTLSPGWPPVPALRLPVSSSTGQAALSRGSRLSLTSSAATLPQERGRFWPLCALVSLEPW